MTKLYKKRLIFLLLAIATISLGVSILLYTLKDYIIFFYTPSEVKAQTIDYKKVYKLGGLVEEGSIHYSNGKVYFVIKDQDKSINVEYCGAIPSLFKENSGAVAEGYFTDENNFIAHYLLAKHDEKYIANYKYGGKILK